MRCVLREGGKSGTSGPSVLAAYWATERSSTLIDARSPSKAGAGRKGGGHVGRGSEGKSKHFIGPGALEGAIMIAVHYLNRACSQLGESTTNHTSPAIVMLTVPDTRCQ